MSLGFLPRQILLDANGAPIVGAQAFIYDPGSEGVLKAIWLNANLTGSAENPVTSIATTGFPVWYVDGSYDIEVKNSAGQTIYTDDGVEAASVSAATTSAAGTVRIATEAEVAAGTPGRVMDTGDIDQMNVDGGQIGGTLGVSTIPNLSANKITSDTLAPARLPTASETEIGAVEKATSSEASAGTADKFIDAALLQAALTTNLEADFTNKWAKFTTAAGTFILQWDTSTVTPNTSTNKTLPVEMADTAYAILVTADDASASRSENNGAKVVSETTIQLWSGDSSVNSLFWIVIGKAA